MSKDRQQNAGTPIAWCATCGWKFTEVDPWLVGARFRCPNATLDKPHVAAVIPPSMKWWLELQWVIVRVTDSSLHPRVCLFKRSAGLYGVFLLGLTVMGFVLANLPWWVRWAGAAFAFWVILDILIYNIRVTFVTQHPQIPLRNALFGVSGFVLVALNFATFYLLLVPDEFGPECLLPMSAIYFSFVTMATVGYGDIHPKATASFAQFLVIAEIIVGLFYIAVVLVTLVAWANAPARLPTLDQLMKQTKERFPTRRRP